MSEHRRLADDLVGAPRWGRLLVHGVVGFMWCFTVLWAVLLPYIAYRATGGVWALVLVAAFELGCLAFAVGLRRSVRLRRWWTGRDDGKLGIDTTRWKHWDRFMR
jgi:hypothetical protein